MIYLLPIISVVKFFDYCLSGGLCTGVVVVVAIAALATDGSAVGASWQALMISS